MGLQSSGEVETESLGAVMRFLIPRRSMSSGTYSKNISEAEQCSRKSYCQHELHGCGFFTSEALLHLQIRNDKGIHPLSLLISSSRRVITLRSANPTIPLRTPFLAAGP